jgi:acetyltransferase-like isoleucine patch superfamily enzyme
MASDAFQAHETAVVEAGVQIGAGTRIWHHAHVREGARIGARCVLGKDVYVDAGVTIGDGVKIQNSVSVYAGVTIEDDVFVGPGTMFTNDRFPRAANAEWEIVPTVVRRGASIGANATIVCGLDIGEDAMVAAGAVVTHPVADHELVGGNPARRLGWVCTCGRVATREEQRPTDLRCEACRSASAESSSAPS